MLDQVRWIPAAMQANLLSLFAPEFNGGGEPRHRRTPPRMEKAEGNQQQVRCREEIAGEPADRRDRRLAGPDAGPADAAREDEQPPPRRRQRPTRDGCSRSWPRNERTERAATMRAGAPTSSRPSKRLALGDADFAYVLHFSEIGVKGPSRASVSASTVYSSRHEYRPVFHRDRITRAIVRDAGGLPVVERRDPVRWDERRPDRCLRAVGRGLDELDAESGRGDRRSRARSSSGRRWRSRSCRGTLRRLVHDLLRRPRQGEVRQLGDRRPPRHRAVGDAHSRARRGDDRHRGRRSSQAAEDQ